MLLITGINTERTAMKAPRHILRHPVILPQRSVPLLTLPFPPPEPRTGLLTPPGWGKEAPMAQSHRRSGPPPALS